MKILLTWKVLRHHDTESSFTVEAKRHPGQSSMTVQLHVKLNHSYTMLHQDDRLDNIIKH